MRESFICYTEEPVILFPLLNCSLLPVLFHLIVQMTYFFLLLAVSSLGRILKDIKRFNLNSTDSCHLTGNSRHAKSALYDNEVLENKRKFP